MAKDFRASQIQTSKLIASGGIAGTTAGIAIYSGSNSSNTTGGITDSKIFDNVGSDVFLFVSGTATKTGTTRGEIALFGGDVVGKKLAQFLLGQNPSIFSEGEISRSMDIQRQEEKIANLQRVAGGDVGPYGDIGMSERAKSQLPDEIAKLEQMRQAQARRDYGIGFGHEFEVQEMQQRDRELEPKRNDSMSDLANILTVGNVSNDNSSNVNNYNTNLQHITFPDMQFQVAANQTGPT